MGLGKCETNFTLHPTSNFENARKMSRENTVFSSYNFCENQVCQGHGETSFR